MKKRGATKLSPEMKQEIITIEKALGLPPLYSVGFRQQELWAIRYNRSHAASEFLLSWIDDDSIERYEARRRKLYRQWLLDPNHKSATARFWAESAATATMMLDAHTQVCSESKEHWLRVSQWLLEESEFHREHWMSILRPAFPSHCWERYELLHLVGSPFPDTRAFGMELLAHIRSVKKGKEDVVVRRC